MPCAGTPHKVWYHSMRENSDQRSQSADNDDCRRDKAKRQLAERREKDATDADEDGEQQDEPDHDLSPESICDTSSSIHSRRVAKV